MIPEHSRLLAELSKNDMLAELWRRLGEQGGLSNGRGMK
jgi:hypothetical protein